MLAGAIGSLRGLNSIRKAHFYHARSNRRAYRALAKLEEEKGPLTKELKEKCNDYAISVLKDIRYAPWLYVYSTVSGQFHEGWIPPNYWGRIVVPKIQGIHGKVSELKSMNQTIFKSDLFPDLLSYINGVFVHDTQGVIQVSDVKDFLFSSGSRVVFKPDNSRKGWGIQVFQEGKFDCNQFRAACSETGVFQRFIEQEQSLASFFPTAVSTLRLNTAINECGVSELRSAHLRLGSGDDTHVTDATQIRIAVCMSTGVLSDTGYMSNWAEISTHPDSKKKFSGFKYPKFKDAVEAVNRLNKTVPYVKCVGWDVCVDIHGQVCIMEWNGRQNGIQFPEATQGPCFVGLGWLN